MYDEDELLPISALQHLCFCERRAALVYIERAWDENVYTAEGRLLHERVHGSETDAQGDVRVVRGVLLRSLRLGLYGKADVVEFHRANVGQEGSPGSAPLGRPSAIALPGVAGTWKPFPVEYKRGRLRHEEGYEVQTCAQALCLEEMLGVSVATGAIFYGEPRRRLAIEFGADLRRRTEQAAARLHEVVRLAAIPPPEHGPKCRRCSLSDICLPQATGPSRSAKRFLARNASAEAEAPEDDADT